MSMLNDESIRTKLTMNLPIFVEGIGDFYAPKVTEIVDMTEEYYINSISTIFFDKNNVDKNINEFNNFEVLVLTINHNEAFRELFFNAINIHFNKTSVIQPNGQIKIGECTLTEEKFEYIKKLIKIANSISDKHEDEYKPGNERAKEFLEKLKSKRKELSKIKKPKMNIRSIISSVCWKADMYEHMDKLTIYQLYDCLHRLRNIDHYDYTMIGIHTGNLDASKIKLPDIDRAKIID